MSLFTQLSLTRRHVMKISIAVRFNHLCRLQIVQTKTVENLSNEIVAHVSLNIIRAEKQPSCNGHFKNISSKATAIAVQLVATKPIFYNHYLVLCKLTVNAFVTIMEKILTFQQI